MTDDELKELVERLQDKWKHSEEDCYAAADAIEALMAERDHERAMWAKADEAEAKATRRAERAEAALREARIVLIECRAGWYLNDELNTRIAAIISQIEIEAGRE